MMKVYGKTAPSNPPASTHSGVEGSTSTPEARKRSPGSPCSSLCLAGEEAPLSHDTIVEELERILASPELGRKPSLRSFLQFVVERTLSGHSHEIKGYTVATQVFGRGDDFDNTLDPIVRIQAGRLRRVIERYYRNGGRHNPVRIEIPKGSYVPTFQRSLPGGELLEPAQSETSSPSCRPAPFSIAVLPLANLTGDPDQDYLAGGLAQELTFELSRCHDLQVIDTHSASGLKGKQVGAIGTGRGMSVRFALAGSIRKDGHYLKVILQLIDTSTRLQVWAEQYRYDIGDEGVIRVQEEIARRAAGRVGGAFGIISEVLSKELRSKPAELLGPCEAFLRFYRYLAFPSRESFSRALEAIEHFLSRDTVCGLAWSMLAVLCAIDRTNGFFQGDKPFEEAMAHARKGAALEPRSQYVRAILSFLYFLTGERDLCLKEAERALGLNPNAPEIMGFAGLLMVLLGKWGQGKLLLEKGMELSPNYPAWLNLGTCLLAYREGRFDKAYEEAQRMQSPQLFMDPLLRAAALGKLGRLGAARDALGELLRLRPDFAAHYRKLIGLYVKSPDLVEAVLDGISMVGLALRSQPRVHLTSSGITRGELTASMA